MPCVPSDVCFIKTQTVQVSGFGIKQLWCAETDGTFLSIRGGDHSQRQSYLFSAIFWPHLQDEKRHKSEIFNGWYAMVCACCRMKRLLEQVNLSRCIYFFKSSSIFRQSCRMLLNVCHGDWMHWHSCHETTQTHSCKTLLQAHLRSENWGDKFSCCYVRDHGFSRENALRHLHRLGFKLKFMSLCECLCVQLGSVFILLGVSSCISN